MNINLVLVAWCCSLLSKSHLLIFSKSELAISESSRRLGLVACLEGQK